uniref:Uncharacterized protein n=1 Tax=Arion vulgaris TaxID=1028688 RepID=A0A0B7AVU1_9EUPU
MIVNKQAMAANLWGSCGAPHSSKTEEKYMPNVKDIIAMEDGRIKITDTHIYRNAGKLPNACRM